MDINCLFSEEDTDQNTGGISDKLLLKVGGQLLGTVSRQKKFFLAFQFGDNWEENSYHSPISFDRASELSLNNWSRDENVVMEEESSGKTFRVLIY